MGKPVTRIGKFDHVRVDGEGPDVMLTMPALTSRAHWTDFAQIVNALQIKIVEAQQWERQNLTQGPGP